MSDTGLWLVVPVRSMRDGKRRLASVLGVDRRVALVRWLLARTLDTAAEFPGLSRTLVVTSCREVGVWVTRRGAGVLHESAPGDLNRALRQARSVLARRSNARMMIVAGDLPLLQVDDLRRVAEAGSDGVVVVAPDETDDGTNALCVPVQREFEFAFGPGSFSRHREHAQQVGLEIVTVRSAGLCFDVDLPTDLLRLDATIPFLRGVVLSPTRP